MINQFAHQGQGQGQQQQQGGYGQQGYGQQYPPQHQNYSGPPQPPAPWIAEWDQYQNRWIYINRETGQRTHEFPQAYGGGYDNRGYGQQGGYPQQGGYGAPPPQQQQQQRKDHTGRNVALGALAGVAGGALLMHEGHKVEEKWEEDKYKAEERFDEARYRADYDVDRTEAYVERKWDDGVNDVENFPENAARWAGEKVQEMEDIPEDIAHGVGNAVGDVERFGDNVEDAYDAGRDEQRYDDERRDDW